MRKTNSTSKTVTCRPCKEENNWEVEMPNGKVMPNHFKTKKEAVNVARKYAIEAGAELEILNKVSSQNKKSQ